MSNTGESQFHNAKQSLLQELKSLGIRELSVLEAIKGVPREQFVEPETREQAYANEALPILCEQTISQPYMVALMTQLLCEGRRVSKVLEVGTGSGYQSAILSQIVDHVYTVERIQLLASEASDRFEKLGYRNIHIRCSDGFLGWPENAPYDGILVTAASAEVPPALLTQLKEGGRLMIPLGTYSHQVLTLITRKKEGFEHQSIEEVRFVPLMRGLS